MGESDARWRRKPWRKVWVSRRLPLWRQRSLPGAKATTMRWKPANKRTEISGWLAWFAGITIEAQRRTLAMIEFLIDKAKLFERLRGQMNERQEKALVRMFKEGPDGFKGGLSAGKYATITGASPATATRDLVDLVEKGALVRVGELRHTRYQVGVPLHASKRIEVNERGELVEV